MMKKIAAVMATVIAFAVSSAGLAADTPKMLWVKAKCALCHGEDGAGNTPEGKNRGVPDLRVEAIQKKSDAELAQLIVAGHSKMPSFGVQLKPEQVSSLVLYIRSVALPVPKKK